MDELTAVAIGTLTRRLETLTAEGSVMRVLIAHLLQEASAPARTAAAAKLHVMLEESATEKLSESYKTALQAEIDRGLRACQ